ncbi:methyltransferase type 11 domain-containing protein [Seiridium cupressi]
MASAPSNSKNFWRLDEYDKLYWENYLAARPDYTPSNFYDTLYSYHDPHSACYDVAHDIGAGPGQVANVIASRFNHVIASDANETHLAAARHHNSVRSNIEFMLCPGEKVAASVPRASCDAIFCAEAIPLMDKERAITGFAKMLKPNGTLAVWFYGRPLFTDGNREACQAIYAKVFNTKAAKMLQGNSPEFRAGWKHGIDTIASWLDNVEFPAETWKDVERRKWNTHTKIEFNDQEAMLGLPIEVASNIDHKRERIMEIRDEKFWARSWNVGEVCNFIEALLPTNHAELDQDPEIQGRFEELSEAMGGEEARRAISWPAVLLLATKK